MRLPSLIIIAVIFAAGVLAQTETLSNRTIIELTKAGLSKDVVIRKIETSNTAFDVSSTALIELKKANVADEVISKMIDRQSILPPDQQADGTPAFSKSSSTPNESITSTAPSRDKSEILRSARTIAFVKSSVQPSLQALEKELLKRKDFQNLNLTIERYKDTADLYVEIGYVSLSWITHRYVYRIYDRSGAVIAAGETTSWGSLAENLARHISKSLTALKMNVDGNTVSNKL